MASPPSRGKGSGGLARLPSLADGPSLDFAAKLGEEHRRSAASRLRVPSGLDTCGHEPHTWYVRSDRRLLCGNCFRASRDAGELTSGAGVSPTTVTSASPIASHARQRRDAMALSSALEEAETLLAELTLRRQQASEGMVAAPSFSVLEAARSDAKQAVDDFLLDVVRHVDATRRRLHSDIDEVVAQRAEWMTDLVKATQAADKLIEAAQPALKRSVSFDSARAVATFENLLEQVPLYDTLQRLAARVSAPLEFQLKKDFVQFDLSAMRVVSATVGLSPSDRVTALASVTNSHRSPPSVSPTPTKRLVL